jgi:hypothetical protein
LLPSQHWARDFAVQTTDIDYLINLLLEKETPLTSHQLARILVENRLAEESAKIKEQYSGAMVYNPTHSYKKGNRVLFSEFDYAPATVKSVRAGANEEYGDFSVIAVQFEGNKTTREFAAAFEAEHKLGSAVGDIEQLIQTMDYLTVDDVMAEVGEQIIADLDSRLRQTEALTSVAGQWFPRDLILELNDGHLNLVEAVLDLAEGGPLPTDVILDQIGRIGDYPISLQSFSMNYTLNQDDRFAEVGPAGEILWYLSRMAPKEARQAPAYLQYSPVEVDRGLLTKEMLALEADLGDELSSLPVVKDVTEGTITLIYPHRRAGTLPLNDRVMSIFPSATTAHIWITLVDAQDGEEYTGWVIPKERYVLGLGPLYEKYQVPIGAYVSVSKGDTHDKIAVRFRTHKARSEWVRLMEPRGEQFRFEDKQRSIGIEYDDLMILGIDDLDAIDEFIKTAKTHKKSLSALLRMLIPELGRMSPQGTAHFATIYSTVNVLRRYPPGPIMATLEASPDFENVGGHYWKLSD